MKKKRWTKRPPDAILKKIKHLQMTQKGKFVESKPTKQLVICRSQGIFQVQRSSADGTLKSMSYKGHRRRSKTFRQVYRGNTWQHG